MEQADIQKRIEGFLKELNIPGFIVFGWQKNEQEFGFVYSLHEMPQNVFVKGMTWVLHDFVSKML